MPGKMLRTNYRATGGIADITALGGAIAKVQLTAAGAGTTLPYGGVIFFTSYYIVGLPTSTVAGDSALGIMSAFYGSGIYSTGYRIQPVVVVPLSLSDALVGSQLMATSLRTSDSCIAFNLWANGSIGAPSTAAIVFTLFGLVISGP